MPMLSLHEEWRVRWLGIVCIDFLHFMGGGMVGSHVVSRLKGKQREWGGGGPLLGNQKLKLMMMTTMMMMPYFQKGLF